MPGAPIGRSDRTSSVGNERELRKSMNRLQREGFRRVYVLKGVEAIEAADASPASPRGRTDPTSTAPST